MLQDSNKGQTPDILYMEIQDQTMSLILKSKQPEVKFKLLIVTIIILHHSFYHWHSTITGTQATKFYLSMLKPNDYLGFSLGKFHLHFNSSNLSLHYLFSPNILGRFVIPRTESNNQILFHSTRPRYKHATLETP